MILYLVKGYLDLAATTLADAQALLTALANPALASNQAIIDKVTGKLETLVQSDSGEPLTISSIDDTAGSYSAWVTDAQTTLAVGLGLPNTSTLDTYASTTSFSITGNTRTGTLALNSRELSNGLLRGGLRLQIRTTNSAGAAETRALLRINVVPGVLESPVGDRDVDYTSYVEVAALATAAAASAAAATTAETNAETAETNAETAQAAAAISAAAALVSENAASASASTATTQAGTATTQAGTATTQAGIATTQAGLATTAKTAAETAETNAETAETNAAASATAANVSAAAALVSEAAALVSKNAAAASAATASAVSGSGNGAFSSAALTGVASVQAASSAGLALKNVSGTTVATFGPGGGSGVAFAASGFTGVNSVTADTSTALTLTGGSTGASLVLGQASTDSTALTANVNLYLQKAGASSVVFRNNAAGSYTEAMRIAGTTGNLLIGTTTDAASLAGGLVVNGSGAGAAASSTTTGALRVTGGVGVSGAGYFGGLLSQSYSLVTGPLAAYASSSGGLYAGFTSSTGFLRSVVDNSANPGAFEIQIGNGTSALTINSSRIVSIPGTTSASSSTVGALTIGNGTAATNVAIGGGAIVAGGGITSNGGSAIGVNGFLSGNYYRLIENQADSTNGGGIIQTLLAGTWTNTLTMTHTGNATLRNALTVSGSTASTGVGSGALQIAGGIYAGAASVFGGQTTVTTAADYSLTAIRTSGASGAIARAGLIQHTTSLASADGHGGALAFGIAASGLAQTVIGDVAFIRSGADTTGDFVVRPYATGTPTTRLTISGSTGAATFAGAVTIAGTVIHTLSATPVSASATGTVGTMSWDANYIYICTATNTWKRVAIATW